MLKAPLSDIRSGILSCLILLFVVILYATGFEKHDILQGFPFFRPVSWLHALWCVWMPGMLAAADPRKKTLPWVPIRCSACCIPSGFGKRPMPL